MKKTVNGFIYTHIILLLLLCIYYIQILFLNILNNRVEWVRLTNVDDVKFEQKLGKNAFTVHFCINSDPQMIYKSLFVSSQW